MVSAGQERKEPAKGEQLFFSHTLGDACFLHVEKASYLERE